MDRGQLAKAARWAAVLMAGASLVGCVTPKYDIHGPGARADIAPKPGAKGTDQPYQVGGIWYVPHEQPRYGRVPIGKMKVFGTAGC